MLVSQIIHMIEHNKKSLGPYWRPSGMILGMVLIQLRAVIKMNGQAQRFQELRFSELERIPIIWKILSQWIVME